MTTTLIRGGLLADCNGGAPRRADVRFADGIVTGFLQVGMPADIVVCDLERPGLERLEQAYDYPADEWRLVRKVSGYRCIPGNGVVTLEDDGCTGAAPGTLLRRGRAGGASSSVIDAVAMAAA